MYLQSLSPAQQVDFALFLVFLFSGVVLIILTVCTVWFIWRYHHTRNPVPSDIRGNITAEILWTLIPSIMVMGLFYYGWTGFKALRTVPPNAMEIQVTARMFAWTFKYPNGKTSSTLPVPVNTPVKLVMTATDVIHSFFAPAFRIKMDVVPGMTTYTWFKAERAGEYDIYCAEYCGVKHSAMMSVIKALPPEEFEAWLAQPLAMHGPAAGYALMESHGCFSCHLLGEAPQDTPSLEGLHGSTTHILVGGKEQTITVDDAYLTEAIVNPGSSLVRGYENTMPPYPDFTPEQMRSMLEYLASVGKNETGPLRPGADDDQKAPPVKHVHSEK